MKQTGKLTATSHKGDSSHKKVYLAFITAGKIKSSIKRPFKKAIIPSLPRSNTTLKKTLKKCPPLRLSKLLTRVHFMKRQCNMTLNDRKSLSRWNWVEMSRTKKQVSNYKNEDIIKKTKKESHQAKDFGRNSKM